MAWIASLDHVQLTVPRELLPAALEFYGGVLGLAELAKPEPLRKNGGAWYRLGAVELHVSGEPASREQIEKSKRHVCLMTDDLDELCRHLQRRGVAIIADAQPLDGLKRCYVRDPGGNRLELAERQPQHPR